MLQSMDEDSLEDEAGASLALSGFAGAVAHSHIVPDTDRVVLHFDVDCFYAQVRPQPVLLTSIVCQGPSYT
jgi:hypothetical protein